MRVFLFATLVLLALGCELRRPWEDLPYTDVSIAAVDVFRSPDDRLCGFLDGRFNQDGTVLSPGSITCDDGTPTGKESVLFTGGTGGAGKQIAAPVAPAALFGDTLVRFEPTSGAVLTSMPDTAPGPIIGVDRRGRTLHSTAGSLVRREADGGTTTLLASGLPGRLLLAPDDRVLTAQDVGNVLVAEVVGGAVVPVVSCPHPQLPANCAGRWVAGFDERGALYLSVLGQTDVGLPVMTYARIVPDRTLHRLPDGPTTFRPNGGVAPCSVTRLGTVVCAYNFEQSDEDNYSHHVELISLSPGASAWARFGKVNDPGSSPSYVVARDQGDCLSGPFSGGFGHILELRRYRFR